MQVNPLRQAVDQLEKLSEYRLFGRVASILGMLVEVGGGLLKAPGAVPFAERVRDAVWASCQILAYDIVLLRRGALAKTSSGKIQRLSRVSGSMRWKTPSSSIAAIPS